MLRIIFKFTGGTDINPIACWGLSNFDIPKADSVESAIALKIS
ncbi:hypothetical protein [Calothrix sp. NIES-2100]